MLDLEDLDRLKRQLQSLTRMRKQQIKLSEKSLQDMSPKQAQKASADQSWLGMEIDKAMREAHAAAVDLGIADARGADSYGPVEYRPSAFHHYRHQPTKPRCRAA
ncbi:regulator [Salipiger thiooxidans]|uniref:regulator n=1 Tax=Salipiger thiooxidans TaxID=282683 RepID=UPI001CD60C4E|nr:regulator [Salipiger thiooxidans]MCA0846088.1 regulator [Salipiger thiooxidans]